MSIQRLIKYWGKPVSVDMRSIKSNISTSGSKIKRIVIAAMFSAVAAIMQSAGALGGPGFVISAIVTLPVAMAAILSVYTGIMGICSDLVPAIDTAAFRIYRISFYDGAARARNRIRIYSIKKESLCRGICSIISGNRHNDIA